MNDETSFCLGELAERFALSLRGDAHARVRGVATLAQAGPEHVSFLANPKYRVHLAGCRAGALVIHPRHQRETECALLLSQNPYADFAKVATLFASHPGWQPGIHPTAVIAPGARVDATASIGPHCSVGAHSRIGAHVRLEAGCVVGERCNVGPGSVLHPRVTLVKRVTLGARVQVHSGAVLGADGFGIAMDGDRWVKVPQLGGVRVGDDCEVGANTTIDCGALDDTVLEHDVRLDNQIQVGHNVVIGAHTAIAGCTAIAGSARIGRYCLIGGGVGIVGHIQVCDRVTITAMSLVTRSIQVPGSYSSGTPLQETRLWRKSAVRFRQNAARRPNDPLPLQDPTDEHDP